MELYNSQFLGRIGSSLGTMLKIERLTYIHSRGKYARICGKLDLEKLLKSFIVNRGFKIVIEYEGLHLICFHCGRYGHKYTQCADLNGGKKDHSQGQSHAAKGGIFKDPSQGQILTVVGQESHQLEKGNSWSGEQTEDTNFRSWMVAASRRPRRSQKSVPGNSGEKKATDSASGDKKHQAHSKGSGSRFDILCKGKEPLETVHVHSAIIELDKPNALTNVASSSGSEKSETPPEGTNHKVLDVVSVEKPEVVPPKNLSPKPARRSEPKDIGKKNQKFKRDKIVTGVVKRCSKESQSKFLI